MSPKALPRKNIGIILHRSHSGVTQKIAQLSKAVNDLRFEGKAMHGKNVAKVKTIFNSFIGELSRDMDLEEKVLFPYLEKHMPKLRLMLYILEEEHENLKGNLRAFNLLLRDLSRKGGGNGRMAIVESLLRKGTYLNYFIHNHICAENDSVYRIMMAELSKDEKDELMRRLSL